MLIILIFSYLEPFFVVFYLSFSFILSPDGSASDKTDSATCELRILVVVGKLLCMQISQGVGIIKIG